MTITLELYLRDQIIRGEVQDGSGRRAVDLLNESTRGIIELHDAWSGSVHVAGAPKKRGSIRVLRSHVLFAIPHDSAPAGPRQLRAGYVDKRPHPAEVGLGPFFVAGTIHIGPYDTPSIEISATDAGKLPFIPLTRARVTSEYDASWSLDVGIVLVNRTEISYVCSPLAPATPERTGGGHHMTIGRRPTSVAEGTRTLAGVGAQAVAHPAGSGWSMGTRQPAGISYTGRPRF